MRALVLAAVPLLVTSSLLEAQVEKQPFEGVVNYSRVDATVGCGGATSVDAIPALKKEGFRSIINLRLASEDGAQVEASRAAAEQNGLKYIHIPFSPQDPHRSAVEAFLEATADESNQPVYIHCGTANRVGALWLIKRVVQDGWPVEKATGEAEAIGLTSPQLKQFALDYVKARGH